MKSDFLLAITQLSAEKNLPKEVVIGAVEAALVSAYRKEYFAPHQNIAVKINPTTSIVEVWAEKMVVEKPEDSRREVTLEEARRFHPAAQIDDAVMMEDTPHNAGRIAAQTAKQVILQRLHEAEHSAILEEYSDKESDIVTGLVQRIEPKQIFVNLGRAEAVLPAYEQVPNERYRIGQRLKVCLLEVNRTARGPRVMVSRSHPNLLRRLFELEVPEVYGGQVEIKSVAREAGHRSKVAVAAQQEGIDPVGCCVGLRGIRIQNVVNELNGEKIDVIVWNEDPARFIANALSPAQVSGVRVDGDVATVIVPDKQLSLAIGKDGQNVRLAAKLVGIRIDIKSVSAAEAERLAAGEPEAEAAKPEPAVAKKAVSRKKEKAELKEVAATPVASPEEAKATAEELLAEEEVAEVKEEPAETEAITVASLEEAQAVAEEVLAEETEEEEFEELKPIPVLSGAAASKSKIRFAEDIFIGGSPNPRNRGKKKKKSAQSKKKTDSPRPRRTASTNTANE